jgi:hypothetical protein
MDGPVILDAKAALNLQDVTPVLKWVKKTDEAQIKAAFDKTLRVRIKGSDAQQLADQFFFETLVRVHRAGEGAPFTGLKPAGTPLDSPIQAADEALETGSIGQLIKVATNDVSAGIRERFADALEKKRHAGHSVEAGRAFVAAYVEYVHYVERLHQATKGGAAHQGTETEAHSAPQTHQEPASQHNH